MKWVNKINDCSNTSATTDDDNSNISNNNKGR